MASNTATLFAVSQHHILEVLQLVSQRQTDTMAASTATWICSLSLEPFVVILTQPGQSLYTDYQTSQAPILGGGQDGVLPFVSLWYG